ncbi:hypothetical protein AAMO2058_001617200 [Amorphochlora amoebiformis]
MYTPPPRPQLRRSSRTSYITAAALFACFAAAAILAPIRGIRCLGGGCSTDPKGMWVGPDGRTMYNTNNLGELVNVFEPFVKGPFRQILDSLVNNNRLNIQIRNATMPVSPRCAHGTSGEKKTEYKQKCLPMRPFPNRPRPGKLVANVVDCNDSVVISCDVPGVKKDDVTITIKDSILTVTGKRNPVGPDMGDNETTVVLNEVPTGNFSRAFRIPEFVDLGGIKANQADGVLTITMMKKPEKKPISIPIS